MSYFVIGEPNVEKVRSSADTLGERATITFVEEGAFYFKIEDPRIGESFGFLSDVSVVKFGETGIIQNVADLIGIQLYQVFQDKNGAQLAVVGGTVTSQADEILASRYPSFTNNSTFDRLIVGPGRVSEGFLPEFYLSVAGGPGIFDSIFGQYGMDAPNDGRVLVTRGPVTGQRDIAWGNWLDEIVYGGAGGPGGPQHPDPTPEIAPMFDPDLGRVVSPLYDISPDGRWNIPSLDGAPGTFGNTRDELFDQISDSALDTVVDQVREMLQSIGVPSGFIDAFEKVKEVRDILTNYHSRLLDSLERGMSGKISFEELERQGAEATATFQEESGEYLKDRGLDFMSGQLHVEEVNSFRVNYWKVNDIILGGTKRDAIRTSDLDDHVSPGSGADLVLTRGGNDVVRLTADGANDQISMGEGLDVAVVEGRSRDFVVDRQLQSVSVAETGGVIDTLYGVERIQFSDRTLALDTSVGENAGFAYRIYQAAFARTPDQPGLSFWINAVDGGLDFKATAQGFITSPEFQGIYGLRPSTIDYVDRLYENILGREGEKAGIDFWAGVLNRGDADMAEVLAGFSESPENLERVAPAIGDGFWYV